jgi:hypothetical protein
MHIAAEQGVLEGDDPPPPRRMSLAEMVFPDHAFAQSDTSTYRTLTSAVHAARSYPLRIIQAEERHGLVSWSAETCIQSQCCRIPRRVGGLS